MSAPILRTGIPLRCPACKADSLSSSGPELRCAACNYSGAARDGVFHLTDLLTQAESVQRDRFDHEQMGATATADPYRSFVTPHGLTLMRLLRRLDLTPGERFIEVGCGSGPVCSALVHNTGAVGVGVDISPASVATQLLRRGAGNGWDAVVAPATELPFASGTFDALISFDLLEHLEHPERLYAEAARVLKPGGRALFRLNVLDFGLTFDWARLLLARTRWLQKLAGMGHYYENFRAKSWHRMRAKEAGLRITAWRGYDIWWDNIWTYELLGRLYGLRAKPTVPTVESGSGARELALRYPDTIPHRIVRAFVRVLDVTLLPEKLLGRLGLGASMWMLAEKPLTSSGRPTASAP